MAIKIEVQNKIEEKIEEYRMNTGATKTWIAEQLGMSTQNLYQAFKANNPTIETLLKFAVFLGVDVSELYNYSVSGMLIKYNIE